MFFFLFCCLRPDQPHTQTLTCTRSPKEYHLKPYEYQTVSHCESVALSSFSGVFRHSLANFLFFKVWTKFHNSDHELHVTWSLSILCDRDTSLWQFIKYLNWVIHRFVSIKATVCILLQIIFKMKKNALHDFMVYSFSFALKGKEKKKSNPECLLLMLVRF